MEALRRSVLAGTAALVLALGGLACQVLVGITESQPLAGSEPVDGGREIPISLPDGAAAPGAPSCLVCGGPCVDIRIDPANCGRCGSVCASQACSLGVCKPTVLAELAGEPVGVKSTETEVVWGERDPSGRIGRFNRAGRTIVYSPSRGIRALAVNALTDLVFFVSGDLNVYRSVRGDAPVVHTSPGAGENLIDIGFVFNSGRVLGAKGSLFDVRSMSAFIDTITTDAREPARISYSRVGGTDRTAWVVRGSDGGLEVDLFPCRNGKSCLLYKGAGDASQPFSGGLTVTAEAVFVSVPSRGEVLRCTEANAGSCEVAARGLGRPTFLAQEGDWIYVSDTALGSIVRFSAKAPTEPPPPLFPVMLGVPGIAMIDVGVLDVVAVTAVAFGAPSGQLLSTPKPP